MFWDLAPHDLSILDYILPGGLQPESVAAHGADPLGAGKACVGHLVLPLPGGAVAHVNVNWLSPTKIRSFTVGGSRRTLVWDDLNPQQRLSVYDRGVDLETQALDRLDRKHATISYRLGDTWSPALKEREALGAMVAELADSITQGRAPLTDGAAGLRVLNILAAASASLAAGGDACPVAMEPVVIGTETRDELVESLYERVGRCGSPGHGRGGDDRVDAGGPACQRRCRPRRRGRQPGARAAREPRRRPGHRSGQSDRG